MNEKETGRCRGPAQSQAQSCLTLQYAQPAETPELQVPNTGQSVQNRTDQNSSACTHKSHRPRVQICIPLAVAMRLDLLSSCMRTAGQAGQAGRACFWHRNSGRGRRVALRVRVLLCPVASRTFAEPFRGTFFRFRASLHCMPACRSQNVSPSRHSAPTDRIQVMPCSQLSACSSP